MTQFSVSLWGDEGWAAALAVKPVLKIIQFVARDTSPPFYYLLLHAWMKIFGTSEIAIRSLSFLFFLITALTVYFIGKHLWDKKTGLLASFLVLTNPFLFNYAFEGRMYALLALTSTLSVYFFLKKRRLAFILASVAALYTHHFSIFTIFFLGLWRLAEVWRQPAKKIFKALSDFLIIGFFYLPWLYPLYYQTSLVKSGFWLGKPNWLTFVETITKLVIDAGLETARLLAGWLIVVTLILKNWRKDKEKSFFLLGWFFAPLVLTYFISQVFQPIFFDRYMLLAIPASSLLIASLRRKFSFIPILLAIFLLATVNYHYFFHPTKKPFRDLANHVKTEAAGLTLVNYNAAAHHLWESKYYGLEAPIYSPEPLPFYTGTALMEEGDVISQLPDEEKIGLITSANPSEISLPGYTIEKTKQFDGLFFLWLSKK